jgi:KDO2-lipid IV(A) lauroyltransferase
MNIVALLQKIGIMLVGILPSKLTDWLAVHIGRVCSVFLKQKRAYIHANLMHILADRSIGDHDVEGLVTRTFTKFALAMVDFFRLGSIDREGFDVECLGFDHIGKALSQKRGCVLVTAHVGNWDYAGAYLAANGVPMNALVEITDQEMFRIYTAHREHTGMRTYTLAQAGYAFLNTIKENRVLAVLADRDIMDTGIEVTFFNAKRKIPEGLGRIIIKRNIPVVFAYMVLHPDPHRNRYLGVIEAPRTFGNDIRLFHGWLIRKLEEVIRRYPDQWFVFHPEWIE